MGAFMANLKGQKAARAQSKGDYAAAKQLYDEALKDGMTDTRLILAYSVLLIRDSEFEKAKDLLVKHQKNPGMTAEQKDQLFMNYAVCSFKLGSMERGIALLEKQHLHHPSGLIYGTLGALYVEAGAAEQVRPAQEAAPAAEETAEGEETTAQEPAEKPQTYTEKALAFNTEAVEYDDEDPVCLDNLGQTYYRLLNDPEKAKEYFEHAIAVKPTQIDTLWFLSRYDLEQGDHAAALEKLRKAAEGRFSPLNYCTKQKVEDEIARVEKL